MGDGRHRAGGGGPLGLRAGPSLRVLALALGLSGTGVPNASGQDLSDLVASCAGSGSPALVAPCQNTVLAVRAIRGGISVADAMGSDLAGTASTLGRRVGRTPRVSLDARFRLAIFDMPDFLTDGAASPGKTTVVAYGVKATAAAGVLDGFSLLPAVGGFLSLDVLASLNVVFLQEEDGFTNDEGLISVGGRLGLLRESFTMPGVTVAVMQHFGEDLGWGEIGTTGAQLDTDVVTTSVRATVGKDLLALGLLAGAGWDWQRGEFSVRVADPGAPGGEGTLAAQEMTTRRPVYYVGASMTHLVFQMSLEAGWAGGFDDLPGYDGEYDPGRVTTFANLALRLTI